MLFDNCRKDVKKTILPLGHEDPSVYPCFRTCIEAQCRYTQRPPLRHNVDLVCDRLKDIPCVVFPKKPESCTYLLTKLELSLLDGIKDDIDFCVKLAREENLVFLPGEALGLKNWMRITIGVEAHMLEDALERLKGFCTRHTKKTDTETESPSSVENE
ncbi:unnamed protein product [Brassica oleracea var. botrytis]|uniref:Aminotransferase class I/classII large domain-containing protein n=1 Tax=Brassica oleracea TaxID=3712 RepID=A0A3P6EB91_BRAOL|nr:unnamed protein product [Brassica oleracea]